MSSPNLPSDPNNVDALTELEHRLTNDDTSIRTVVVGKLRKMIDQDPEKVVKGLRHFLHQGTGNEGQ